MQFVDSVVEVLQKVDVQIMFIGGIVVVCWDGQLCLVVVNGVEILLVL